MKRRYLVTMTCLVKARSDKKALDQLTPAVERALKVAVAGVGMKAEEASDDE